MEKKGKNNIGDEFSHGEGERRQKFHGTRISRQWMYEKASLT